MEALTLESAVAQAESDIARINRPSDLLDDVEKIVAEEDDDEDEDEEE